MRKWAFFVVAAAAAIIGCGGGGGGSSTGTTGTTSTTSGGSGLVVSIPTPQGFTEPPGKAQFGYLTGQGRSVGDLSLIIDRIDLSDEFGSIRTDLSTHLALALSNYSFQLASLTIPFSGENSRLFSSYQLDPTSLDTEQAGGSFSQVSCFAIARSDGTFNRAWPPNAYNTTARVFPGRSTLVPIFVDDSMFSVQTDPNAPAGDPCGGQVAAFDEARFLEVNELPLKGFINDYISFDISKMSAASRPRLSAASGSAVAARIMFTGDNISITGSGNSGNFEVLTLFATEPIVGTYRIPGQLPTQATPGTFTLAQLDPTDLFNLRKIVALQGEWKPYTSVISGFSQSWNMISFPTSVDGFDQELAYFKRDANGNVVDFYFGYVNFDSEEFHLFPVSGLVDGLTTGEIIGNITGQYNKNGSPTAAVQETRLANFSITTSGALPNDAPTSGSLFVFRI